MNARRRSRVVRAALAALVLGVGVDAVVVEPNALVLTAHAISARVEAPLTVVHLSDLHTTGLGRRERNALSLVTSAQPDVIVVTGDVVDTGDLEPARAFFTQLHAPLGVFVVRGNWENWRPTAGEGDFYRSVNATLLVNEGRLIRRDVWIGGVDDPLSGRADFGQARAGAPPAALPIFLIHAPEVFDDVARDGDLVFAGHTHGGQVRLPLLGALWKPPGSGRFLEGWYAKGGARLLVSRGVGTSILPVRLLCAPEVARITITP